MESAVVLLSGGQDSTTCLFWAIHKCGSPEQVRALSFDYGQRHLEQENEAMETIASMAGVVRHRLGLSALWEIGDSALVNSTKSISAKHNQDESLPASFVPGRNLVFLAIAGAYAYKYGIRHIVIGVSQTDYSGYPDCRNETIRMMGLTLTFGLDKGMFIHTPLMFMDKARIVNLASSLPGCWEALAFSHTCYEGKYPPCTNCPACVIRAVGFINAEEKDPLFMRYAEEQSDGPR